MILLKSYLRIWRGRIVNMIHLGNIAGIDIVFSNGFLSFLIGIIIGAIIIAIYETIMKFKK